MTARSKARVARDARAAGASFVASAAGSAAFAVAYFLHPVPWLEGCALSLAFAGMATGLSVWALGVLEPEQTVDERERFEVDGELPPEAHMPPAGHLDEWFPYGIHKVVLDKQVPEAVGAFIEVRHRKVQRHCLPLLRPP